MEVRGLNKVLRNIAKLDPKTWKKDAMKEMRDSHKAARADMRNNAPVGATKKLRRSIRTQAWVKMRGGDVSVYVRTGPRLVGRGRLWYAHYPELGTDHSKANHFIKGAKDKYESSLRLKMVSILQDVVKKANGR